MQGAIQGAIQWGEGHADTDRGGLDKEDFVIKLHDRKEK
tara:strand:- start:56 stop:172 length:117 start_codon:yes stop_codon:yes gene_type:complete